MDSCSCTESIFVSVASYRDSQCQYTLQDLFEKARRPERVVAGVCFQVAAEDEDSFLLDLGPWASQIRTVFLHHSEAKGPCYARARIQQELFRDEDYYFQIDSHMRFAQDWDEICLQQLSSCSPRAVLTTYAGSYTLPGDYTPGQPDQAVLCPNRSVAIICADTFGDQAQDDPFLRIKTRNSRSDFGHQPPPALFWTARFAFSRGPVVREVPYDPHLEYVFFGEEISMSARLWTSGWDLFNPTKTIAYHLGSRSHRQWFREVQTSPEQIQKEQDAKGRICGMLGVEWPAGRRHPPPPAPYGLGLSRTLADYERFAGVDFKRQAVHERGRNGGLSPGLFPPQWAEEEREKVMRATQLLDVQSWAGKGNSEALSRQFPELAAADGSAAAGQREGARAREQEAARARELAVFRVQALQSRLAGLDDEDGTERDDAELELCRALCSLGRLDAAEGGAAPTEAYARALEHAEAAADRAPAWRREDPRWRALAASSRAAALLGAGRSAEAKGALSEALRRAAPALLAPGAGEAEERLACDVIEGIHAVHEKTDDRRGLEGYVPGIVDVLAALRRISGDQAPVPLPVVTADVEEPPQGGPGSLRALLLERAALVCIATGRESDMAVVGKIFTDFCEARESPSMQRLLGMLQCAGALLGPP